MADASEERPSDDPHSGDDQNDDAGAFAKGSTWLLVAIATSAFAGGLLGWLRPEWGSAVGIAGDLWLRMLRMLVIPLIVASMIHGVANLGDVRELGALGGMTIGFYVLSSAVAGTIGLVLVNTVEPGIGVDISGATSPEGVGGVDTPGWQDMIRSLVTPNLFQAAADTEILPLILFSLAFGAVLTTIGEPGERVIEVLDGLLKAVMKLVHLVMLIAPLGIFGLVAARVGDAGGGKGVMALFQGLAMFALVVVSGLAIHMVVVLGGVVALVGKKNPLRYVRHLASALTTAFATASSAATLPVTMNGAEEAGVSEKATRFVLPLGATINMDGSALYEAVAALFIAQAYGIDIGVGGQIVVVITAVLSSVGAAGIPEAGLVTMVVVLQAVGLPLEGLGLLLAIDWLLDRFRTAVNVWGDAVGAAVIDRAMPAELAEEEANLTAEAAE